MTYERSWLPFTSAAASCSETCSLHICDGRLTDVHRAKLLRITPQVPATGSPSGAVLLVIVKMPSGENASTKPSDSSTHTVGNRGVSA